MKQPRNPLRINVGFLLKQPFGTSRDIHFEFPELHLQPDLDLTDFAGAARISRTPQGIFLLGDFRGTVTAACVRCLTDFNQPLHTKFEELFAFDKRSETDSELILPEDGSIDMEPLVREYLLIEVPISQLCKEDCAGLCTFCGINLNEVQGEHVHLEEID